jgi:glucose/arabinose dehydrogenase
VTFTPRGSIFPNIDGNVTTDVDTLRTILTDLHKYTEYAIVVSGFTTGDGNKSQPVMVKTDSDGKIYIIQDNAGPGC